MREGRREPVLYSTHSFSKAACQGDARKAACRLGCKAVPVESIECRRFAGSGAVDVRWVRLSGQYALCLYMFASLLIDGSAAKAREAKLHENGVALRVALAETQFFG